MRRIVFELSHYVSRAARFVEANYPQAKAAFLGGSAASGTATESSDLDILILLPQEWAHTSFVETSRFEGQLVEAFVYGLDALHEWTAKGRSDHRPVLDRLIADGVALVPSDNRDALVASSKVAIAAGPQSLDQGQVNLRRYSLSALVDDLQDAADPGEHAALMTTAWREAAEAALLADGYWIGSGKWLIRELRAVGDRFGLAACAEDGFKDGVALSAACRKVLDTLGGYLQEDFIRGTKPSDL